MNIESQVKEILSFIFNLEPNADIGKINVDNMSDWDSMKQVAIISAIENEFDLFIDVDDAASLTSYEKIVSFINKNHE